MSAVAELPSFGALAVTDGNGSAAEAQLSGKRTVKSNAPIASSADSDRPQWPSCGPRANRVEGLLCHEDGRSSVRLSRLTMVPSWPFAPIR